MTVIESIRSARGIKAALKSPEVRERCRRVTDNIRRSLNFRMLSGIREMRRISMIIIVSPIRFFFGLCFLCAAAFGLGVGVGSGNTATDKPENATR
ncbi:hypothetical protein [Sorangium sp. So ce861]|uniref:hypothetical protein n=1 Tax=Sorangium sp. So ce861 TaxID=3133323 RepID=UPI003F63502C